MHFLIYAEITSQIKDTTPTIVAYYVFVWLLILAIVPYYMFVILTKDCWSSWSYCSLQVVKDVSKFVKMESWIPLSKVQFWMEVYVVTTGNVIESIHKQKLQRMVANKWVGVGQIKRSRIGSTCNKILNIHSRETCVGEFLTHFS